MAPPEKDEMSGSNAEDSDMTDSESEYSSEDSGVDEDEASGSSEGKLVSNLIETCSNCKVV